MAHNFCVPHYVYLNIFEVFLLSITPLPSLFSHAIHPTLDLNAVFIYTGGYTNNSSALQLGIGLISVCAIERAMYLIICAQLVKLVISWREIAPSNPSRTVSKIFQSYRIYSVTWTGYLFGCLLALSISTKSTASIRCGRVSCCFQ